MTPGGMPMALHPTLDDILDDFLYYEMARVIHQGAELEVAMKLYQAQMKEVCHSIKAHGHWVRSWGHIPTFSHLCELCEDVISPEFDMRRHRGRCTLLALHGRIPIGGIFLQSSSLPIGFMRTSFLPSSRGRYTKLALTGMRLMGD